MGRFAKAKAPEGKFIVVAVDTFDGSDWIAGTFDTLPEAKAHATKSGGTMLKTHVYNDKGEHQFEAGSF